MSLLIQQIKDAGVPDKERLVLEADAPTEIGYYAVAASRESGPGKVSSRLTAIYWFPDGHVEAGDLVILYTKSGSTHRQDNRDGSKSHFYYWGKQAPLWADVSARAVVLQMASWQVTGPQLNE